MSTHPLQDGDKLDGLSATGGPEWRTGQIAPDIHPGPPETFTPEGTDQALEMSQYGDDWDPDAPMRVFIDTKWDFDPDKDGDV